MRKGDRRARIYILRRGLFGDSRLRERQVAELVRLVKEEERERVLETLDRAKEKRAES